MIINIKFDEKTRVTNNGNWDTEPTEYQFVGDNIEVRDKYHSMDELYNHRMALNIVLFNRWAIDWKIYKIIGGNMDLDSASPEVIKSKLHDDGTMFEGYFIVMATTPTGQISYHYKLEHWDKFNISEVEKAPKWDGHNSQDVIERLMKL